MLQDVKIELGRNLAVTEENEKISAEYKLSLIRLFLTVEEAKDLLRMIEEYNVDQAKLAS
jgi:hypothetical protein